MSSAERAGEQSEKGGVVEWVKKHKTLIGLVAIGILALAVL